jgi:hypothetical protein
LSGDGLLYIDSAEAMGALAEAAQRVLGEAEACLHDAMTIDRCREVRALRIGKLGEVRCSWREVALACHEAWGASWDPPGNQMWGIALCEIAAAAHGEDYLVAPWN